LAASPPEPLWSPTDVELGELGIPPAIRPDGRFIASATQELPWYDVFLEDPEAILPSEEDWPAELSAIKVWDLASGQEFFLPHKLDFPDHFTFHPTEPLLATVDQTNNANDVLLWQLQDGIDPNPVILSVENNMPGIFVSDLAFSPSGKKLFATYENALRIWDVEARQLELEKESISNFTISSDGKLAAVSVVSPTLKAEIWDIDSLEPIASLDLVGLESTSIQEIDANNTLWAMTDSTGTVLVWNWSESETPLRLDHAQTVSDMAFTANGQVLLTVTMDGTIHTWILAPENLIETACSVVSRSLTETEWNTYIGDLKDWRETCEA
jgi:WD40 repeat protein